MVLDGSSYKYVPNKLTIKPGDIVRFHSKTGGAHNVQFYPDSIPPTYPRRSRRWQSPRRRRGAASPASR